MSLNHELADAFSLMADLTEIKGENSFKALAFRKVARVLGDSADDVRELVAQGRLNELEGVGKSSQRVIEEYVRSGRSTDLEELRSSVPAGLLKLLRIEGMGPKTVALLWRERQITGPDDLLTALNEGRLAGVKGLGEKKLAAMRHGLELLAQQSGRKGLGEVLPVAVDLLSRLRQIPGVLAAEIAGSLRRRRETIGDVDLLCSVRDEADGAAVTEAFVKMPGVERILGHGPVKASVVTGSGLQVDLRVLPEVHFGAALMYFTGSKDHNVKIRGHAQKKGLTLNEWGLYRMAAYEKVERKPGQAPPLKPLASKTEAEIYRAMDMEYIEPELREDRGEVEAALGGNLPKLVALADLRGDLHCHTTASDGHASIEEMAAAAMALGYDYLAITDHSGSQAIANGLSPQRLLSHVKAIRKAADRIKGIALLAGSEVDILADGRLDYEDAVLAELDIVIASPHFALKQDATKATDRLVRAIENPYVNIIGHPTGRMIGGREGLPLDFAAIFRAASATGTALEINSGWPRLDLNEVNARAAINAGVKLSINTDAHSTGELLGIHFGLGVARRAWVTAGDVINCMTEEQLRKFLRKQR